MDISGAIFNMDGTLLDSMQVWNSVASEYIEMHGKFPEEGIDKNS